KNKNDKSKITSSSELRIRRCCDPHEIMKHHTLEQSRKTWILILQENAARVFHKGQRHCSTQQPEWTDRPREEGRNSLQLRQRRRKMHDGTSNQPPKFRCAAP